MSLTDQLQSAVSVAATLEKSLADQAGQMGDLIGQIRSLTAANAALRQRLESAPTPVPDGSGPPAPALPPVVTQWGFAANETDPAAAFAPALARTKADGGAWLRLWHSSFGPITTATAALIDTAAAAGVRVTLCVQPKDGAAEPLGAPDFAGFVSRNAGVLRKVTYVEAGNELNLAQFRPDDLGGDAAWPAAYVARWLRPLSTALAAIGVRTLCTSIADSYHPENYVPQYDALLAAGAADCCDGVALHVYFLPQALQTLSTLVAHLRTTWNRPIHVTECNVLTKNLTPAQWQERFPPYLATLRTAGVAAVYFYRGFAKANGKWTWPTLFDSNGQKTAAYDVLLAAMRADLTPSPGMAGRGLG